MQGKPVEIAGYYHADVEKIARAMRPSQRLNAALALLAG